MEHIFITGITGTVGSEVVRWLSTQAPGWRVTCLVRASSAADLDRRWRRTVAAGDHPRAANATALWTAVAGDVTEPGLGLDERTAASLRQSVTRILHLAAHVKFLAPLDVSRRVNVEGFRHVAAFARGCARLEGIGHVSSAFVAGRRQGRVFESDCAHTAGFANVYEQTKFEAELLAHEAMADLPISVYRLGLLAGRASDGHVESFGAFHQGLHFYYYGMLPIIPAAPENRIDIVATDWAVDVLLRLFVDHFTAGKTFHVCAGDQAVRVADFVAHTTACFARSASAWRAGAFQSPELVDAATYEAFAQAAIEAGDTTFTRLTKVMGTMVPHLLYGKVFDRSEVIATLGSSSDPPPFEVFYPRILDYCIRTDWGRRFTNQEISYVNS